MAPTSPAMKTSPRLLLLGIVAFVAGSPGGRLPAAVPATVPATSAERVGVYDSRAVAYAHFWSADADRERRATIAAAKAAQAAGDTAGFKQRSAAMAALQQHMHEEVFSTAPCTEALAALAPRLPGVLQELGVTRLVSKWDAKALRAVPAAARVEVTEELVRQFLTPNEKQRKVLDAMKTTAPLSLWRIKLLNFFGAA